MCICGKPPETLVVTPSKSRTNCGQTVEMIVRKKNHNKDKHFFNRLSTSKSRVIQNVIFNHFNLLFKITVFFHYLLDFSLRV